MVGHQESRRRRRYRRRGLYAQELNFSTVGATLYIELNQWLQGYFAIFPRVDISSSVQVTYQWLQSCLIALVRAASRAVTTSVEALQQPEVLAQQLLPGRNYWGELSASERGRLTVAWGFNIFLGVTAGVFVRVIQRARQAWALGETFYLFGVMLTPRVLLTTFGLSILLENLNPAIIRGLTLPIVNAVTRLRQFRLLTGFGELAPQDARYQATRNHIQEFGAHLLDTQRELLTSAFARSQLRLIKLLTGLITSVLTRNPASIAWTASCVLIGWFGQAAQGSDRAHVAYDLAHRAHMQVIGQFTGPSPMRLANRVTYEAARANDTLGSYLLADHALIAGYSSDVFDCTVNALRLVISLAMACPEGLGSGFLAMVAGLEELLNLQGSAGDMYLQLRRSRRNLMRAERDRRVIASLSQRVPALSEDAASFDGSITLDTIGIDIPCRDTQQRRTLFKQVSLHVSPAELVILEGANGVGKTTLLEIICGLTNATAGLLLLGRTNIQELDRGARHSQVTYVSAEPTFKEEKPVIFNILYALGARYVSENLLCRLENKSAQEIWDFTPDDINELEGYTGTLGFCLRALEYFGVSNLMFAENTSNLSTGQKKRIAFVVCMIRNTKIKLFDEPTAGLDSDAQALVADYIKSQTSSTRVVVTHHAQQYWGGVARKFTLYPSGLRDENGNRVVLQAISP